MTNNYNEVQEKLLLALSSHGGAGCHVGQAGPALDDAVADAVGGVLVRWQLSSEAMNLPTDWRFVWGPGVAIAPGQHLNPPDTDGKLGQNVEDIYAANVMYAAYNEAKRWLFISLSATNDNALYDLKEDFRIHTLEPWPLLPKDATEQPKISAGSVLALRLLRTMRPTERQAGAGQELIAWLRGFIKEQGRIRITVGGQSLGGILSALVALWLFETQGEWNPDETIRLGEGGDFYCWRVAGPTPGDGAFKTYFNERVPETTNLINYRDVAPLMFDEEGVGKIADLYDPIRPGERIEMIIAAFHADAKGRGYTQVGTDSKYSFTSGMPNLPGDNECLRWTNQMGFHHLNAYIIGVGLEPEDYTGLDNYHQFNPLCSRLVKQ